MGVVIIYVGHSSTLCIMGHKKGAVQELGSLAVVAAKAASKCYQSGLIMAAAEASRDKVNLVARGSAAKQCSAAAAGCGG